MKGNETRVVPWLADIVPEAEKRAKERGQIQRAIATISPRYDAIVRKLLTELGESQWGPGSFRIENWGLRGSSGVGPNWGTRHRSRRRYIDWETYDVSLRFGFPLNNQTEPTHFTVEGGETFSTEKESDPLSETALKSTLREVYRYGPKVTLSSHQDYD